MTLVKRSRYYHFDFWFRGTRYQGTTDQAKREDALRVESKVKERLRLEHWDLAAVERMDTPSFTAWAEQYLTQQRKDLTRPDIVQRTLRMVLAFWGARPTETPPVTGGVYHDLRLLDPISEPDWIVQFDAWMEARELSGSTRNSYRAALSGMYELALKPRWRKSTRVKENPFRHIDRDRTVKRRTRLPLVQLRAWLQHADPHARLALAIGALAPKLRLTQVLTLRYDQHLDADLSVIRFREYKTARHHDQDQETPVVADLKLILQVAKRGRRRPTWVVRYRGKPVKSIKRALKSAARDAGLVYGLAPGGITFHSLRHAMATEIARLGGISRILHASTMGHADPRTTEQFYTHMLVEDERPVLEQLATRTSLAALLVDAAGNPVGTRYRRRGKNKQKRTLGSGLTRAGKG